MLNVSAQYREAMKQPLRERSYMRVTLGVVNYEAQDRATLTADETEFFSTDNVIGAKNGIRSYAGFDAASVDGNQILLPEDGSYIDTGLTGAEPLGDGVFEVAMTFSAPVDIKGVTLTFDEAAYPTQISIETDGGEKQYTNDAAQFITEDSWTFISYMNIRFSAMNIETARFRLKQILFGYGLTYTNDDIISSEWRTFVNEVSEEMPQVDVSVTLKNYDMYFDPDNPASAINYLDSNMPMQVYYGMTLPNGEVEWLQAANCYISEWRANNKQATISATDVLRSMEETYNKGQYAPDGVTLYALAEAVMQDAGVTGYYIDPYLKNLKTKNPVPRIPHKEALQLIANAARCVLTISRKGVPQIVSSFSPDVALTVNAEAPWSNHQSILEDTVKQRYSMMATGFIEVDGGNTLLMPEDGPGSIDSGFVSAEISGADGTFENVPTLTITQETAMQRVGMTLRFGSVTPRKMVIETFSAGERVEYLTFEALERDLHLSTEFQPFDVMHIRFPVTEKPYQPVEIEYLRFEKVSQFYIKNDDMTTYPTSTNEKSVKRIDVISTYYNDTEETETLFKDDVAVESAGEEQEFYMDGASYGYSVSIESGAQCSILASGAFYVRVRFATAGTHKMTISGHRYNVTTSVTSADVQQRGDVKTWENPLIGDVEMAKEQTEWLAAYYKNNIVYEYSTRGNPELDPNDVIYQESKYVQDMKVRITQSTIRFNGALSGNLKTRRVV